MRGLDGITDAMDMNLGDSEGQGSLMCCSPWSRRVGHDWATEQEHQQTHYIDNSIIMAVSNSGRTESS